MAKKLEEQLDRQSQLSLGRKHLKKKKFAKVIKRDGKIVKFDPEKIVVAILKAGEATGEYGPQIAEKLAVKVVEILDKQFDADNLPSVEKIQDLVEHVLMDSVFYMFISIKNFLAIRAPF